MKIDETDRKIIGLLHENARRSNAEIARTIGVSEATVRRRIKIMVSEDVLAVRAVPDPGKFGFNASAMIGIDVQPDMLESVANALNKREEIVFLGVSTGRYDLLARLVVRDLNDLRDFLESFLAKVPGIRKTETMVLLDVKKRSYGRIV